MQGVALLEPDSLTEFRSIARKLLSAGVPPAGIAWGTDNLFGDTLPAEEKIIAVPRAFADLAGAVICHRDEARLPLLYEALWRIDQGDRTFMDRPSDPLRYRLHRMEAAVRRDRHRMTAFVRFRAVPGVDGDTFVAWYEPRHRVLRRTASFFTDRFTNMRFSILTPDLTLHWDGKGERFGPGLRREDAASDDAVEEWWRRYYSAIFNPARLNAGLMASHMPRHFWRDLPEARTIRDLIEQAGVRTDRMIQTDTVG